MSENKGNWYTVAHLVSLLYPDPERSPEQADQALSRYKRTINDLLKPYLQGEDAIESWPYMGYRIKPIVQPKSGPSSPAGRHTRVIWVSSGAILLVAIAVSLIIVAGPLVSPPRTSITITIASSSTKKEWINQAVAAFIEESKANEQFQIEHRAIVVTVLLEEIEPGRWDHYRSGSMIRDILSRKIEPTIASPAEQSWILDLKESWPDRKPIVSDDGPGLVRTPLVIAMWRSRAMALGCWPTAGPDCTWERLRALASSTEGWGILGHPEWGKLKYGYGFVGKSNSATFTMVLNCMSGLQKTSGLTLEDVRRESGCGHAMLALRKPPGDTAVIRIYEKSEWALRDMWQIGPSYLDAVTTYEQEVTEVAAEQAPRLPEPIVAAYPQDGVIMATHPFTILDGAPWVTLDQAKAARIFRQFLLSRQQQSLLLGYGFRPADAAATLGPRIDPAYGVNPQANLALIDVPHSLVIDAIVKLWEAFAAL
ncbi:MAG: substrate-binding domain-containing protein [Chloroflexi bacterium]|nr:substrate-binding domain-containing protein [Chloroflexota bacterium]